MSSLASMERLNLGGSSSSLQRSGGSGPINPPKRTESQPALSSLLRSGGSGPVTMPSSQSFLQSGLSSPSGSDAPASPFTPGGSRHDLEKYFKQSHSEARIRSKEHSIMTPAERAARRAARRQAQIERAERADRNIVPPPWTSRSPRTDSSMSSPRTESASPRTPKVDPGATTSSSPKAPMAPQKPGRSGSPGASPASSGGAANVSAPSGKKAK